MNKVALIVVIILVIVVAGILSLGKVLAPQEEAEKTSEEPEQVTEESEQQTSEQKAQVSEETTADIPLELFVGGAEFSFDPSSLTVRQGQRVKINFQNIGSASHDFVIEGQNIATKIIGPGQTDTVEFTAPAAGTYTFFCSVPGHREAGMAGTLTVE